MNSYKVIKKKNLLEVRMMYTPGFSQSFLLTSDIHFDSKKCKRDLYFSHLEEAKARKAGVFCFGDFLDIMGAKIDRRSTKSLIRDEYNRGDYFGSVLRDAADQLGPYSEQLIMFSDGNHETAILKHMEFDPLDLLIDLMDPAPAHLQHMPYMGFVKFVFEHASGGRIRTKTLGFHHGLWGGIISKGSQSVPRMAAILPDCDIIVSGHTHDKWVMEQPRYRVKANGETYITPQLHLKCGTYKEEFAGGSGWAIEKIGMPKSLGGWWLNFKINKKGDVDTTVQMA